MRRCILTMDVGGTFIKHALMWETGLPLTATNQSPACADGDTAAAIEAFTAAVAEERAAAEHEGAEITAVAVAFPGPFDYDRGIPLMKHKFQALYGISVTPAIEAELPGVPVCYLHDSTAFLLGEALYGAAREAKTPAGIMLGTGLGFAWMRNGRVCVTADQRPAVRVWNRPCPEGILEDLISSRAVTQRYERLTGRHISAKEAAQAAFAGDANAVKAYRDLGEEIGEHVGPILEATGSDCLVIGGQVARSAELFLPYVKLRAAVCCAQNVDSAALLGACAYARMGRRQAVEVMEEFSV